MAYIALALIQVLIAAAYVVIGVSVLPRVRFGAVAAMLALGFFLLCAGTHFDLARHTAQRNDPDLIAPHMWALHVSQAVIDWAFIFAVRRWKIEIRRRPPDERRWLRFLDDDHG